MDVTRSNDETPTCTDKVVSHLANPAGSAYANSKRNFREAVDITDGPVKFPRKRVDCSREVALELCVPFEHSIFVNVEDLVNALNSPLISSIPFDRYIDLDSAMNDSAFFSGIDGREAVEFVRAIECFELRSKELRWVTGKNVVICAITSITGVLWRKLAALVGMSSVLTYDYGKKHITDESVFLDGSTVLLGKHKEEDCALRHAVADVKRFAPYGIQHYDVPMVYFPVYVAAGCYVEFGLVDYRTNEYHQSSLHNIITLEGRVSCFVAAINMFRLIRTLASCISQVQTATCEE